MNIQWLLVAWSLIETQFYKIYLPPKTEFIRMKHNYCILIPILPSLSLNNVIISLSE